MTEILCLLWVAVWLRWRLSAAFRSATSEEQL